MQTPPYQLTDHRDGSLGRGTRVNGCWGVLAGAAHLRSRHFFSQYGFRM